MNSAYLMYYSYLLAHSVAVLCFSKKKGIVNILEGDHPRGYLTFPFGVGGYNNKTWLEHESQWPVRKALCKKPPKHPQSNCHNFANNQNTYLGITNTILLVRGCIYPAYLHKQTK